MNERSTKIRQRVIETLSLVADKEAQRRYQMEVPDVDVAAELFNQWEDCYFPQDIGFREGFSNSELDSLERFDRVLNRVCGETPQCLPPLEDFIETTEWKQLSCAALEVLDAIRR